MIKREKYLAQLIANKENGFPKVITGIRRCGKSFLLKEIYRRYLIDSGLDPDHILSIELDIDTGIQYRALSRTLPGFRPGTVFPGSGNPVH